LILLAVTLLFIGFRYVTNASRYLPALDTPRHLAAADADLPPDTMVISAEVDRLAQAWPLEVLIPHHLINDLIGNMPALATW
jgi:hypothetical protein